MCDNSSDFGLGYDDDDLDDPVFDDDEEIDDDFDDDLDDDLGPAKQRDDQWSEQSPHSIGEQK